jgi:hypothetical protein
VLFCVWTYPYIDIKANVYVTLQNAYEFCYVYSPSLDCLEVKKISIQMFSLICTQLFLRRITGFTDFIHRPEL